MTQPRIRELTRPECEAMLASHRVGRMAFAIDGRVDVEPIHYVFDDGWLFGRTSHGAKRSALAHRPWVAFEVDDVHGVYDWSSVVAHGTVYFLEAEGGHPAHERFDRAVGLLRTLEPRVLTADDPAPARTEIFGLHVDELSGRRAEG